MPEPRRKIIPASTSPTVAKQHSPVTIHINPCIQFRFILHLLRTTGKPSCWLREHPMEPLLHLSTRLHHERLRPLYRNEAEPISRGQSIPIESQFGNSYIMMT